MAYGGPQLQPQPPPQPVVSPAQPVVPPVPPVQPRMTGSVPVLNLSHFKPEFADKPDEDAEVHL